MTIENLIEGLTILKANGAEGYCISAGHDAIYGSDAHDVKMNLSIIRKLYKLGWHIEDGLWTAYT